jgi:predicted homoserine dehydrogenase-like protein
MPAKAIVARARRTRTEAGDLIKVGVIGAGFMGRGIAN